MNSKKSTLYAEIFSVLKNEYGMDPVSVKTDFEKGLRKGIHITWPQASVVGCFFHYIKVK